jgi:hydroxymethylpyrimidine pyrophosphatase-like HAD family hydrolase
LTVYRHCDSIDITPSEITKYTGLEYLGKVIGINPGETIAVGDGVNDYPMFQYAGYTVGVNVKNPEAVRVNFRTINDALQHIISILK